MKKFYSFLFAAVALVGFAACSSDIDEEVAPECTEKVSFIANIDDTTKTGLDGNKTTWVSGDRVVIEGYTFTYADGVFTCVANGVTGLLGKEVTAVYSNNADGKIDSEAGVAGAVLEATGVLAENGSLSFKVTSAFLKFSTVDALTLKGAGLFSTGDTFEVTEAATDKYVAINAVGNVTLSYTAKEIEVKSTDVNITASKIYKLGFLETPSDWEVSDGTRFYTTETTDLFVAKNVKLAANNFCLHKVGDSGWQAGAKYGVVSDAAKSENVAIGLYTANWAADITISNASTTAHDIYFDKANSRLYVLTVGKTPAEIAAPTSTNWYNIAGTMTSWGVDDNYKFTYSGDNVWHIIVDFAANDEFKVQLKGGWSTCYGHYALQEKVGRTLSSGSDNAEIKTKGTYEIWVLPSHSQQLYMIKL